MLALLLCLGFVGLGYRLVDLQVLRHEELAAKARWNHKLTSFREPRRGDILDAQGNPLATSVFVKTICADPSLVGGWQRKIAQTLAPLLQVPEAELEQRLQPRLRREASGTVTTNRYVVLKRKVSVETWQQIQQAMAELDFGFDIKQLPRAQRTFYYLLRRKAVFADSVGDQLRIYPNNSLAAHVLGYVGTEERDLGYTKLLDTVGRDGIELALNRNSGRWLAGDRD